jgi:DNA-binding NarL/FixJ family response regulator
MIRVLIVDDVAQVRQSLRTVLPLAGETAGLEIEIAGEASSGAEAILMVDLLHPDAVLMDLEMPGMDGCKAAQIIKASHPHTWLVALTVHAGPEILETALQSGFDEFFVKGVSAEQIVLGIAHFGTNQAENRI